MWKSEDGGDTLVDISTWWDSNSAHSDHHTIVAQPSFDGITSKTVYFGNDGGIYKTDDILTVGNNPSPPRINGWKKLDNTYSVTQFYGGACNVATGVIIGGAQDNGTLKYNPADGSEKWTEMYGGDGGFCAADPKDPNVYYGEYVYGNVHRSIDGSLNSEFIDGQLWNGSQWVWKPIPFTISDAQKERALFISPFVLDPNNINCILVGCASLWRTNDSKAALSATSGPRWEPIKPSDGTDNYISAVTVAVGDSDRIWVGHSNNGDIFTTKNGTATVPSWIKMDDQQASNLPNRYCTRITVDPKDHNIVYVTFGGYTKGNIWKSVDDGANWTNIGNGLPEAPVRSCVVHPLNSQFLYIGTEVGLFASEDGGATWSPTNQGPTNCSVDELFWMGKTLVAATHGRGMFTIDLSSVR